MIDQADLIIRQLFLAEVDQLVEESQVRFDPPNSAWRSYVSTLTVDGDPANALNVFLWDARENRDLRSNAREHRIVDGRVEETRPSRRLDCHFIVTAWSPAVPSTAVEPSLDEHRLLHEAASALMRREPLVASDIFAPTPLPPSFPQEIANTPLPIVVAPADAPVGAWEFWSTMGEPWRPSLHLVLTLPVSDRVPQPHYLASTTVTRLRPSVGTMGAEANILIAGRVVDNATPGPDGAPSPLAGVRVRIGTQAGLTFRAEEADASGVFAFGGLAPGTYRLSARMPGRSDATRDVTVPSVDGDYDLPFA